MKTAFLSVSLLLLLHYSSKAQTAPPPAPLSENLTTGFVALNYGTAMPLGNYSSTSNSSSSGYAQPGSVISISEGVPINHSNFGIAFKFDDFSNGYDVQSFTNNESISNSDACQYVSAGSYSGQTILIGLYGTIPIHKFAFDYRFMGGLMFASYPSINFNATDNNVDTVSNINQGAASSSAFAYDIGIGLRWNVTKHFCLRVDYDYMSSSQSFSIPVTQDNISSGTSGSQSLTYKQQYTLANITFGIGYVFDRKQN